LLPDVIVSHELLLDDAFQVHALLLGVTVNKPGPPADVGLALPGFSTNVQVPGSTIWIDVFPTLRLKFVAFRP
jgi:hypothetical protein